MVEKKTTAQTLTQALTAFQADLPRVELDAVNPHFKSKYASLGSVTKAVLPKLTEHGFAFSVGSFVDNGLLVVDAHLMHESGESRSLQFPITETNPQKIGSALSYARRYALSALTGVVADEDDDGNAASTPSAAERQIQKAQSRPTPTAGAKEHPDKVKVREWIAKGEGTERRDAANAASDRLKKDGISGDALWTAIAKEVGAK